MPVDMKNVIASTFAAMAKQKGIDKITVKALIDACGISRQTFYYHFQDIMEVVEWSLEQVTQDAAERSLQAESPEKAIGTLISLAMENRTLIRRLLDSQRCEQIEKLFVQATRTYLQALIRNRTRKMPVRYEDMEVALDFWAFGISGLLLKCCVDEPVDADKLAAQICRMLPEKSEEKAE